jgi:hypothetical protein
MFHKLLAIGYRSSTSQENLILFCDPWDTHVSKLEHFVLPLNIEKLQTCFTKRLIFTTFIIFHNGIR